MIVCGYYFPMDFLMRIFFSRSGSSRTNISSTNIPIRPRAGYRSDLGDLIPFSFGYPLSNSIWHASFVIVSCIWRNISIHRWTDYDGGAQWFRTAINRDVNTGSLARPFARSLAPLIHSLPSLWENEWFDVSKRTGFVTQCGRCRPMGTFQVLIDST